MTGTDRTGLRAAPARLLLPRSPAPRVRGASGFPEPSPLARSHGVWGKRWGFRFLVTRRTESVDWVLFTLVGLLSCVCLRVGLFLRNGAFSIRKVRAGRGGVPGVRRVVRGGFMVGSHRFLRFRSGSGLQ